MNSLDFLGPLSAPACKAQNTAGQSEDASANNAESFDALMNRALEQPTPAAAPTAADSSTDSFGFNSTTDSPVNPGRRSKILPPTPPQPAGQPAPSTGAEVTPAKADEKEGSGASHDGNASSRGSRRENDQPATARVSTMGLEFLNCPVPVPIPVVPVAASPKNSVPIASAGSGAVPLTSSAGGAEEISSVLAANVAKSEPGKDQPAKIAQFEAAKSTDAGKKNPVSEINPAKIAGSDSGGLPVHKLLDKAEVIKETPANIEDLNVKTAPAPAPAAAGTSAAQQALMMKDAEQATKLAGDAGQNLPGAAVAASGPVIAARAKGADSGAVSTSAASEAAATANASATSHALPASETSTDISISASSQTELRARAVERAHDIVALHAMRLKDANLDSLNVVIKPGTGLQLSLQLKQNGDGVEAQAVLQRGDFNQLNQHWPDLQQRLEQRGVKLAPLGGGENSAASSGENFQRQQKPSTESDTFSAGAFAEFALASSAPQPAGRATAHRGWESWA